MAEIVDKLNELRKLPPALHPFCPRQHDDDEDRYEDQAPAPGDGEDTKFDVKRHDIIEEAKERRAAWLDCLQLFAYNGDQVEEYKAYLSSRINTALGVCDMCVRGYYLGKQTYLKPKLRDDYEDHDVDNFFKVIDQEDIDRICRGLKSAAKQLQDLPPEKRRPTSLDQEFLLALFESLSCEAFLRNEDLLRQFFDEPFKLVQTRSVLRTNSYTVAATRFLFDSNQVRRHWATTEWTKIDKPPTEAEFDWTIRDHLSARMSEAQSQPTAANVQRFWRAMSLILNKLEKQQITHNLRALEIDVCRVALEHFSVDSPGLHALIQCFQRILKVSPTDFWDAMASVRPSTVVEQICNNPRFDALLNDVRRDQPIENTGLGVMLSWVLPFIESIKPANHPVPCETITEQLLKRFKNADLNEVARLHCFSTTMEMLAKILQNFVSNDELRTTTPRGVLTEIIDIVTRNVVTILEPLSLKAYPEELETARSTALQVIRLALTLETQNLKSDFEILSSDKRLLHSVSSYSKTLWENVISSLNEDDTALSAAALSGIFPLPGLEELALKDTFDNNNSRKSFNGVLQKFTRLFANILERLGEFKPEHLDELFKNENTSMILISGLAFSDDDVYQAASDLIKTVSGQFGRQEAMAHLLQAFFTTTLSALSYSFRRLARMRTFAGVPRMIKTGMDVLSILTDSQTGLLRTQKYDRNARLAINKYWAYQWQELRVIFNWTERWYVPDKSIMKDFCRDAMQYAEALYEQYSVFANTIVDGDSSKLPLVGKQMLEAPESSPAATLEFMVKWLRLRDEYLVKTLVVLLSKLLQRLGSENAKIDDEALHYVEDAAINQTIKTNLTQQQKAELIRALESYLKKPYELPTAAAKKKQKSLKDFVFTSASGAQAGSSKEGSADEYGDSDLADADLIGIASPLEAKGSGAETTSKAPVAQKPQPPKAAKPILKSRTVAPLAPAQGRSQFLIQREKEREEIKRRNAEAAARLRGSRGIGAQTKGQGSGVTGIGVEGKDHSTNDPNGMMVSSDSESDSEDEIDKELFGHLKPSKKLNTAVFPGMVKHQPKVPVKKIKQLRSAKDMRARLAPDLSTLHKTILSWDFFADGDLPPNANKDGYSLVSNTFRSALEYQNTFQPLLILEGWQSFRSAREEGNFKAFGIKVANRLSVDSFVEVSTSMTLQEYKEFQIRESDIVLLSTAKQPWADPSQPHCLARVMRSSTKKGDREIVYRVVSSGNKLSGLLTPGTMLWGASLLSLTPLEREYGGLSALPYYDLADEIIRAKPSPLLDYSDDVLQGFVDVYDVNAAQAKAIKSAMDNDAFTLIQGPPGSGKTKTICALVGAILSSSPPAPAPAPSKTASNNKSPLPVSNLSTAKKILVCAPSNAAVDELVMRFKSGVKTMKGKQEVINVVRLGRTDAINSAVKDVTIDELVAAKLSAAAPADPDRKDMGELMQLHKEASEKLNEVRNRLDQTRAKGQPVNPADTQEFEGWKRKKATLGAQIDGERDKKNAMDRDKELNRRRIQQEIIDGAHVLCATLSGSGHEMFQNLNIEFDTVIIDEAAQSVELSALIPLKYGCSKCILVGDPRQLPPTVLSKAASKYAYEQSLFARMEKNHPKDVHLLDTQYRMHPEISKFPSKEFYESRLKDGPGMAKLRAKPWHHAPTFGPYRFFDVQGMHQSAPKGHSLVNLAELQVAMQLYERLTRDCHVYNFKSKIGIITPYKGQLRELKLRFSQRFGEDILSSIEFNTTDAFQGRECEIIIFSCVRASTKSIGFLDDVRRMNVGLTRAKSSLWVLGNSQSLMIGEYWKKLVLDAKERSLYTDGDILAMLQKPILTPDMMRADIEMTDVQSPSSSSSPKSPAKPTPVTSKPPTPTLPQASKIVDDKSSGESDSATPTSLQAPSVSRGSVTSREGRPSLPSRPASAQSFRSGNASSGPSTPNFDQPPRPNAYGPSGGGNGLNDSGNCGICGSFEHYTHNCDNYDARVAAKGLCSRCKVGAHLARECKEIRCLECGDFGHEASACTMKNVLGRQDKERIARQEASHKRNQEKYAEKARSRQLGEHGAKVPVVRSTAPPQSPLNAPAGPSGRKPPSGPRFPQPSRSNPSTPAGTRTNASTSAGTAPPSSVTQQTPPGNPANAIKRKRSTDSMIPESVPRDPKISRPSPQMPVQRPNPLAATQRPISNPSRPPVGLPSRPPGNLPPRPGTSAPTAPKGVLKRPKITEDALFMKPKKR